jgi:hypothetical protein
MNRPRRASQSNELLCLSECVPKRSRRSHVHGYRASLDFRDRQSLLPPKAPGILATLPLQEAAFRARSP